MLENLGRHDVTLSDDIIKKTSDIIAAVEKSGDRALLKVYSRIRRRRTENS